MGRNHELRALRLHHLREAIRQSKQQLRRWGSAKWSGTPFSLPGLRKEISIYGRESGDCLWSDRCCRSPCGGRRNIHEEEESEEGCPSYDAGV
jgi:hypothetical protein